MASLISHMEKRGNGNGITTARLRSRLASANYADPQFRLWSHQTEFLSYKESNPACTTAGQYTFGRMSSIRDPFWA